MISKYLILLFCALSTLVSYNTQEYVVATEEESNLVYEEVLASQPEVIEYIEPEETLTVPEEIESELAEPENKCSMYDEALNENYKQVECQPRRYVKRVRPSFGWSEDYLDDEYLNGEVECVKPKPIRRKPHCRGRKLVAPKPRIVIVKKRMGSCERKCKTVVPEEPCRIVERPEEPCRMCERPEAPLPPPRKTEEVPVIVIEEEVTVAAEPIVAEEESPVEEPAAESTTEKKAPKNKLPKSKTPTKSDKKPKETKVKKGKKLNKSTKQK